MASSFLEQKARQQAEKLEKQYGSSAYGGTTWLNEQLNGKKKKKKDDEDIAPVRTTTTSTQKDERKWFEKGAFEDGYQFGDVVKTLLGTDKDILDNMGQSARKMAENVVDAGLTGVGWVAEKFGGDKFAGKVKDIAAKDLATDKPELFAPVAKMLLNTPVTAPIGMSIKGITGLNNLVNGEDDTSVLGDKSDTLVQSATQFAVQAGLTGVGVPWYLTAGVTSFGGEAENAFQQGATYNQAALSGVISAGSEILTEKLFGGSGLGEKGLINLEPLTKGITNKVVKTIADYGIDLMAEGSEEVVSQVISNLGSALYKEENLSDILLSEEALDGYIESFIGGVFISGGANAGKVSNSIKTGRDYRSGLSANEQAVVSKEVENRIAEQEQDGKKLTKDEKAAIEEAVIREMEKGYISTETIEEVLGGEDFENYRIFSKETGVLAEQEKALKEEFGALDKIDPSDMTGEERGRWLELKNQLEDIRKKITGINESGTKDALQQTLSNRVMELAKNDRLAESYNERSRRGQAYQADLSKYDAKQQATIQKAVDSGILNNTNRTHEFVDLIAKITADKGVPFDFTNNAKLKESGFALDGKTINGYVTKDGVTLNIDSAKSLNSVVGHEITHVLEGTEMYTALQSVVTEYAKTKGEYQARYDTLAKLYEGVEGADINAELTADLVGDYLFTDTDFVKHLSVTNRNVFQKIYDEIKYLCKVATAGSKELRELEKAKRVFAEVYRESGKAQTETKYSLESVDGINYVKAESNIFLKEDGTAASERDIFNALVGKTIPLPDGDVAIVKNLPGKDMYNELYRRYPANMGGVSDAKQLNTNVNHNMEELLANSDVKDANVPDVNGKHQKQGVTAFDTRTVKFYDGNGAYDVEFSIAVLANGEKVAYAKKFYGYDGELTKKIQAAETGSELSPVKQQPVFNERITQDGENVKHSLSDSDGRQPAPVNGRGTFGKDIALETAPVEEVAPVKETVAENATVEENLFPDDLAPIADDPERFDSLDDADAPPVQNTEYGGSGNPMTMPKTTVNMIADNVRESLWVDDRQIGKVRSLVEEYGKQEFPDRNWLFRELKDNFGKHTEKMVDETTQEVKSVLRKYRLNVSDAIKGDIADYNDFRRRNFGKVLFSRQGMSVDSAYEELSSMYPSFFPADITNPTDQLLQIVNVANMSGTTEQSYELDDDTVWDVVDDIAEAVSDYQYIQMERDAGKAMPKEAFDDLVQNADAYAPLIVRDAPAASGKGFDAPVYDAQPSKGVVEGQQSMLKEEPRAQTEEERKQTRKQLHQNIVDGVKADFKAKGLDFDKVLKNAKNLSTFATVDNMPQRVMEKALGYKEGQTLSDLTVNKVAQNETEGIKWLNSYTDRKSGLLKQLSARYNIKPGSKESAAAQMYAEGFYVAENNDIIAYGDAELAKDFPDAKVQANIKGLANDPRIRRIYDDTLAMINASRTRNAYPEIPRLDNYFLHFRAMDDTFSKLGLPFNPNDIRAKDLPTDLNGVTADLKPGQPYFASAMHRTGKRTSFDLLGGLERYLSSAKNQIYHIDDIQTLRALRNYIADTYGQANGLEGLDALSEEEAQERIEKVYNSHLSTFAKFLNEEANILAGKTALIDRGLEGIIGRRGITFLDTVNKQVGSNMVGFNISSSLTNFLPVAQTFAKTNKFDFVKAFGQTVGNKIGSVFGRTDSFAEQSPVIIRRKGADRFYRTPWQKAGDAGYVFMSAVDDISTELIARTKFNELTRKGMDAQKAHYETDKWVSRLMGDRSLGQMPQLYNSKMLGLVTKFQLEVRNQLDSQFYDTVQETKASAEHIENGLARNAKIAAKVASTFTQLAVVQHLFGKAFESVAGYNPAFDIISVLLTAFGYDDEEDSEDTALDNIEQAFLELLEDLPYTSVFTDGGRIPISSALPIGELIKGEDEWGNEKSRWKTLGEIAPYYALPGGYGQIKKTKQGLSMFSDDHPIAGSYTDSGNLRFPVEDTLKNRVQAGIFGQWANENARDYFDNERSPLKPKQIEEFIDLDLPIRDYWEYREGLSGLSKLAEKADYIAGLDLPIDKKNLLINNIADRKEDIDMTGYDDYAGFEEFDFAVKNPEKYEIAEKVGGYEAYKKYQDGMKDMKLAEKVDYIAGLDLTTEQKNALINGETDRKEPIDLSGYDTSAYSSFEEFEYAKEYPEKYAVAKAVGGYDAYKSYSSELYDIKADKDENGKSISGSRKEKVQAYINDLDADYYTKIILWKSEYTSDDTYNNEIIEYLNSRDDISFEETIAILRKLGFDVTDDGDISW